MSDDSTAKIRLQPEDIFVPPEPNVDPFANDAIGRRTQAERLTRLVERIEGPCVIALDAPYGAGKTTFLRMWAQKLRNEGFQVAEFNAWTSDFDGKPFNALATQIVDAIDADGSDNTVNKAVDKLKDALVKVAAFAPMISLAMPEVDAGFDSANFVAAANVRLPIDALRSKSKEKEKSIQDIREALAEYTDKKGRLVVLIDELDRCRPPYAIETLEVAKHIFNAKGVVFALGLHRQQLTASIKSVYGQDFDAQGYLERFFDLSASLPVERGREGYVKSKLGAQQLRSEIVKLTGNQQLPALEFAENLAVSAKGMTARLIDRFAQNLKIIMVAMPSNLHNQGVIAYVCVGLALKLLDPEMYARFNEGDASDKDVFDRFIENHELEAAWLPPTLAGLLVCAHIDIIARLRGSNISRHELYRTIHEQVQTYSRNFQMRREEVSRFPDVLKELSPFCADADSDPKFLSGVGRVLRLCWDSDSLSYWEEAVSVIEMFGE